MVTQLTTAIVAVMLLVSSAPSAYAQDATSVDNQKSLIISEIQANGPGSGTTTQEYIELYNNSDTSAIVAGYSIVYKNSSDKETVLYTFSADSIVSPHSFVIGKNFLTSATYLPDVSADFAYTLPSSGLPASSGSVIIKNAALEVVDEVSWSGETKYIDDSTITGLINGSSVQRLCANGTSLVTDRTQIASYYIGIVSPLSLHCPDPSTADIEDTTISTLPNDATTPDNDGAQAPVPQPERVRLPIYLNELFIDPDSPLTDANDEYVELYNPNDVSIDVTGYTIIAGTTTKYRYTFPSGTVLAPQSYIAVTSALTPISLSNSGTMVELLNDLQQPIDSINYSKVQAGEAWARNSNGDWVWTSSPTLAASNIITIKPPIATVAKPSKKSTSTTKVATKTTKKKTNFSVAPPIQINEIYPNPISPETDANDEFIELYNPHPMAINITDYAITAGETKQYKYIFPEGTVIAPGGYFVIDSAGTPISLSNDGGTVRLINNFDKEIDAVTYSKAASGQSYARDDFGNWQWTTAVTKLAENTIVKPGAKITATNVAGASTGNASSTDLTTAPKPLPSWALALLGFVAVCYAAYEYRFEARNYFHKLREHRTAG